MQQPPIEIKKNMISQIYFYRKDKERGIGE